jgi:hypothetical protein
MKVTDIIEGLQIIQKYKPENESDYHLRAEYDEICVGSLDWLMSEQDKARMIELGWVQDDDADGWSTYV